MSKKPSTKIAFTSKSCLQKMLFTCTCFLGIAFFSTCIAQTKAEKPGIFYAITGNGLKDTSWLFGTYHLVKSSYLEDFSPITNAFKKSAAVVVEMVTDSADLNEVNSYGMLKENTLQGMLDKPFRDSLDAEINKTLGVGLTQLNQLKPMNVMLILSMVYVMNDNQSILKKYSGPLLDAYFAEAGIQLGKRINPLETMKEQMDILFNQSTIETQVNQLQSFIRNKPSMISEGNELLSNWFKHDLEAMYLLSQKNLPLFGSMDDLLKKRNERWMKRLPSLMKEQSQFIAVGALHLAGPEGLVAELKKMGFQVKAIKI